MQEKRVSGFSKKSKQDKIDWLQVNCYPQEPQASADLKKFWHPDAELQKVIDAFSENTVSNFILPFGVAPNFLINDRLFTVPMVIEESSVVAAAGSAAKFWLTRGGFSAQVKSTIKLGQVHFSWFGPADLLKKKLAEITVFLRNEAAYLSANMEKRGGGILDIELLDFNREEPGYFQLKVSFETCDSMGANFINSVLEQFGESLQQFIAQDAELSAYPVDIIMAILSNFTPDCIVRASVQCPVEQLAGACTHLDGSAFAEKFYQAIRIAQIDPYRATTHNKGIFNGIDAVVLATGNDFRAIEACGHTFASASGQYKSLSSCRIEDGIFHFWMDLPLAVGTVGGLTKLHPLAKRSLDLLGQPDAETLMGIIAVTGLAQNFAAVRSLITTGIQKGHMKMHLQNILHHLTATDKEAKQAIDFFHDQVISFNAVQEFLNRLRTQIA